MVFDHKIRKKTDRALRIILFMILFAAVVCCASGCGGEDYPEIKIDAVKMANTIIDNVEGQHIQFH